jgi:hypothetical protein
MGVRLLPLNVAELCAHALLLEREATQRFGEYAKRMKELGDGCSAELFEELRMEGVEDLRALERATDGEEPVRLSPWEYAWRMTYAPDGLDHSVMAPANAREAMQLALLARRRAEAFYGDVAAHAGERGLRACAAELASRRHGQVELLETLLADEH